MRFLSGVIDQFLYFVAVDATDFFSRETGLSSFTVYRSRDGGAAAAMTTPTINETDVTNMPGVYELLLDEDMTIGAGNDEEAMVFHITHAGMAPVTIAVELYRPKITEGDTLATTAGAVDDVALTATVTDLTNTANIVTALLTTQMTEAYAANGVAPTLAEATFAVHQMLMQFGIATTAYTVRKLDDSTTAFIVTLDDATNPADAKRV